VERCLFGETFVETLELTDEEEFLGEMGSSDFIILL
jgi:tRNA 2-thiouridine synthesizing protein C